MSGTFKGLDTNKESPFASTRATIKSRAMGMSSASAMKSKAETGPCHALASKSDVAAATRVVKTDEKHPMGNRPNELGTDP